MKSSKSLEKNAHLITKLLTTLEQRSSSNSNEEDDDDDEDTDNDNDEEPGDEEHSDRTLRGEDPEPTKTWADENPVTQEQIDDIWADKSPEYRAATPTYIRQQFGKDIIAQKYGKVGKEALNLKPVGLEAELMSGLQVVFNRCNLEGGVSTDNNSCSSDVHSEEDDHSRSLETGPDYNRKSFCSSAYKKLKENPIFNPDMSLNLEELAKLSQQNSTNETDNWISKSMRKRVEYSESPTPNPPSPYSSCCCSPPSRENSLSLSHQDEYAIGTSCTRAPYSCSRNQNQSSSANPRTKIVDDDRVRSEKCTKSSYLPQFSRSAVGGSKFLTNCHPYNPEEYDGLEFESRFESGNLAKAVQITPAYYELYLRPDLYTSRSRQWFYFRVRKTKRNMLYR